MGGRRSDLRSEAVDAQPRGLRWLLRTTKPMLVVGRAIVALQAVGGAVGIVVGAATLNGTLVIAGLGQLLLAGVLLGLNFGSEHVSEVRGPGGAFVIRANGKRAWRTARGLGRIAALINGERAWTVRVRRREDDPFGPAICTEVTDTERTASDRAKELAARLRRGEDVTSPIGVPGPTA